jgi:TPR repeat protein
MPKKLVVMVSLVCACFVGCGPKTLEEKAEAGDAEAQYNLGKIYYEGEGDQRLYKTKSDNVVTFRKTAEQAFAAEMNQTITYVASLGYIPAVSKDLGGSGDARNNLIESEWTFNQWFSDHVQGELGVAPDIDLGLIMKNDITLAMARVRVEHPEIRNFQLSDPIGTIIASSERPKTKNARNEKWWREAIKAQGEPYLEGMFENGTVFVHYSIWSAESGRVVPVGVMRVEVQVADVVSRIPENMFGTDAAIIVMGARENPVRYFSAGSAATLDAHAVKMMEYISRTGREKGYYDGIHYSRGIVEGFALSRNIRLLAMTEGSLTNFQANRPVPQDYKEALKWFRLAAYQGYATAQVNLGVMYDNGEGVPQDDVQAYAWYNLASANGDAKANQAKAALAKKMTPEQIALGQELARELDKKINAAK